MLNIKLFGTLLLIVVIGVFIHHAGASKKPADAPVSKTQTTSNASTPKTSPTNVKSPAANTCTNNKLDKNVVIDISAQHLWACQGTTVAYDSAVITGMEMYPADLTPTGTFHIYAKTTGQTLAGHDDTGSWSDYVNYWMPFLDNQYGTYGFHDLTTADNGSNGRADNDFGNVDINAPYTAAKHASHGCVELPLATAKWLYGWSSVGTTVTIQS